MRSKTTMLIASLALAIAAIGASSASAATLYTTSAHTTPVAVGTTFYTNTASGTNYSLYSTTTGLFAGNCATNRLSFQVTQNSGGVFKANITSGNLIGCTQPWSFPMAASGTLQISGSAITVGTKKAWLSTTLTHPQLWTGGSPATYTASYTAATGNPPVNGAWTEQPTAGGAPITIMLNNALGLTAPGRETYRVTAGYTAGWSDPTAASYSLG